MSWPFSPRRNRFRSTATSSPPAAALAARSTIEKTHQQYSYFNDGCQLLTVPKVCCLLQWASSFKRRRRVDSQSIVLREYDRKMQTPAVALQRLLSRRSMDLSSVGRFCRRAGAKRRDDGYRKFDKRGAGRWAFWGAQRPWLRVQLVRRHGRLAAGARQVRRHADPAGAERSSRQPLGRTAPGFRIRRPDHRHAANGHAKGLRLERRPLQRQRPANPWPQFEHGRSLGLAVRQQYRGRSRDAALGALVPTKIIRRQDRH